MCHQYSMGDDRLMNEQKRVTPEWTESVIPVRPIIKLEHCQIATLAKLGYHLRTKGAEEELTLE